MATIKPKFEMGFGATEAAGASVVTEEMVATAGFAIRHFCFDDEGSFVGEAKFDDAVRDMLRAVLEAADRCGMSAILRRIRAWFRWNIRGRCGECNGNEFYLHAHAIVCSKCGNSEFEE